MIAIDTRPATQRLVGYESQLQERPFRGLLPQDEPTLKSRGLTWALQTSAFERINRTVTNKIDKAYEHLTEVFDLEEIKRIVAGTDRELPEHQVRRLETLRDQCDLWRDQPSGDLPTQTVEKIGTLLNAVGKNVTHLRETVLPKHGEKWEGEIGNQLQALAAAIQSLESESLGPIAYLRTQTESGTVQEVKRNAGTTWTLVGEIGAAKDWSASILNMLKKRLDDGERILAEMKTKQGRLTIAQLRRSSVARPSSMGNEPACGSSSPSASSAPPSSWPSCSCATRT